MPDFPSDKDFWEVAMKNVKVIKTEAGIFTLVFENPEMIDYAVGQSLKALLKKIDLEEDEEEEETDFDGKNADNLYR